MTRPLDRRIAVWSVPLLLVIVALVQILRAVDLDQSSYAGYGFGMVATYENELSRWTEVTATSSDGSTFSVVPPSEPDLVAQEVPTSANLEALARSVLQTDQEIASVEAELWTVTVAGRPMRLERHLLVGVEIGREP